MLQNMGFITNKQFGKSIKKYRKKARLTIEEAALKSGIRPKYYKRIEEGTAIRLTVRHMLNILDIYGIELKIESL